MSSHTLVIMAFNKALPSALMGIADMLAIPNLCDIHSPLNSEKGPDEGNKVSDLWEPRIVIASLDGRDIVDGQGRTFKPDCALQDIDHCHGVLIPGFATCAKGLPPNQMTDGACQSWLKRQYEHGALLGGSCSGAFVLGEAGLLNKRRCTTTWWLHYELTKRFPLANTAWGSSLIQDGNIITSAGPLSWANISLRLMRSLAGCNVANRAADFAVLDTIPNSQERYILQGHLTSTDPFVLHAEQKVRQNLSQVLNTVELASILSVSERTLHRRLKQLTGESPKTFMDRIRMDMAKTLLYTNNEKISSIALDLGYTDESVFRRLFSKQVGMSPSEYRSWQRQRQN
ncbi:helix-turn-helix domain-containing protein [Vibrio profundum]|uniref:GlxA family transcriptional regulator n=1 Tax=Vibrio profundum TaxID=2910247 RepID=UPI003D0CD22E